ncbi:MAG: type II/IV secretion system protein [Alphaproteobacteria bacterium]|nr:type II/IV secretion system protein [Alphaproteobacteria bacterium]
MSQDLVQILRARGQLDDAVVERIRGLEVASGEPLHHILSRLGFVAEDALAEALAEALGLTLVQAADYPIGPPGAHLSASFLRACRVLPLADDGRTVTVAMADPLDRDTVRALELKLDRRVLPRVAVASELERQLNRLFGHLAGKERPVALAGERDLVRLREAATDEPVVRFVNDLIATAVEARASDIHLEPGDGGWRVRLRIDGALRDGPAVGGADHATVTSRIKIMAGLDIVERRRPQDGRSRAIVRGRPIDVRVSCVPTVHGESVVLRILDRAAAPLDLARLGLSPSLRTRLSSALDAAHGVILATGPTGSGKTTTLYAALGRLDRAERKLITVEDPVEYELPGVHQIQVHPAIGLGFPQLLRSILRHDPDVILVGEIRDRETAEIAVQAALTGHLVLTTLHTNDAPTAITRLADMGVEPFLMTSTIRAVVAQRLVRTLCPQCRTVDEEGARTMQRLGHQWHEPIYRAAGCERCGGTGYAGRTVIAEFLAVDEAMRRAILDRVDAPGLAAVARAADYVPMREDGFVKVLAGETSLAEVLRATQAT